jgi:hypothetical protein
MLPLPSYHTIYLIIKLSRINLTFVMFEDYFISIEPFIDSQLLHESQTSLLPTKYQWNITNFGVYF